MPIFGQDQIAKYAQRAVGIRVGLLALVACIFEKWLAWVVSRAEQSEFGSILCVCGVQGV